jgi:transcriptional regulator with XRE-family HTH domain
MISDSDQITRISGRIQAARRAQGMSQQRLADRAGLESRQVITKIETGRREDLSIVELTEIADALGVSVHALIDLTEPLVLHVDTRIP